MILAFSLFGVLPMAQGRTVDVKSKSFLKWESENQGFKNLPEAEKIAKYKEAKQSIVKKPRKPKDEGEAVPKSLQEAYKAALAKIEQEVEAFRADKIKALDAKIKGLSL